MLTIYLSKSSSTLNFVHSSKCEVRTLQGHLDSTLKKKKRQNRMLNLYAESFTSFYYLVLLIIHSHPMLAPCPQNNCLSHSQRLQMKTQIFACRHMSYSHMLKEHARISKETFILFPHRPFTPTL